ncbi:MAG: hypothetical protein ACYDGN_09125 [Acidimicrobiales bacterium]
MPEFEPRDFLADPEMFGDPRHGPEWVLPEGAYPEELYSAVFQHEICAAFKSMLQDNVEDGDPVFASGGTRDYSEELTTWWQDRLRIYGRCELRKDSLVRMLNGQDRLNIKHVGWILMEVPRYLKPAWENFYVRLRAARALARPNDV